MEGPTATASTAYRSLDDDLRAYVDAFAASSNRSRWALFAVIVATVLLGIANYNFQPWSWPLRRIDAWYGRPAPAGAAGAAAEAAKATQMQQIADKFFAGDVARLEVAREEYLRQFAGRSVFNASPIPGVSIDFNDLGILGGIALVLLMLVLVISLHREHGNLYLGLYKVRRLAAIPGEAQKGGESLANFLYHALAMNQALSAPPTLARWGTPRTGRSWARRILIHFGFIYFLPTLAHGWVLWANVKTVQIGAAYGAHMRRILITQGIITALLLLLSGLAFLNASAMAQRWERAFFHVNPGRAHVYPMSLLAWFGLKRGNQANDATRRLASELVDTIRAVDDELAQVRVQSTAKTADELALIRRADVKAMTARLTRDGESAATEWCAAGNRGTFGGLRTFRVDTNQLRGDEWVVAGMWTFAFSPSPDASPPAIGGTIIGDIVAPDRGDASPPMPENLRS